MRAGSKRSTFRTLTSQRRWSEGDGRRVVEAWKASGLSVAAFARKVGLPTWRVRNWRRRLGHPEPAPRFLPVQLVGHDRERGHDGSVALEINTRGGTSAGGAHRRGGGVWPGAGIGGRLVLTLPPAVRVFLCCEPTDMRKSFDGLEAARRHVIKQDVFSGHLFVFQNRRGKSSSACSGTAAGCASWPRSWSGGDSGFRWRSRRARSRWRWRRQSWR